MRNDATWNIKDVMFLQENQQLNNREAAMKLNRSEGAVYQKRRKLGLRFNYDDAIYPSQVNSMDNSDMQGTGMHWENPTFEPDMESVNEDITKITINGITLIVNSLKREVSVKF